jgi:hypothetical protein
MKIELFKTKKNYKKEDYKVNVNVYWKIIILFSFFALSASFLFAYNFFIETNKEENLTPERNKKKMSVYEKERIKKVIEYFSEREKKSAEILDVSISVIDPSL